jgi:DNA processing protein
LKNTLLQQQIALTFFPGLGRKRIRKIVQQLESVELFFTEKKHKLLKIDGLSKGILDRIDRDEALRLAEPYAQYLLKKNYQHFFFTDDKYPKRLNQCADAPVLLFGKGKMHLDHPKMVAIVGTRNATSYGKKICENLIQTFADKNILVVSGLAYGIDIYVHQLCIKHQVETIGVLGHGLDRIYPAAHKQTAIEMLENGGLLTEFLPGTNPDRENFPMRNRIVAGMCDATIVVESSHKGGSLITADLANEYARDVFAFPGDITREFSRGCNDLIKRQKAHLIASGDDFLEVMNWKEEENKPIKTIQQKLFISTNQEEQQLIDILVKQHEQQLDVLALKMDLPVSRVSVLLLNLEFQGIVQSLPGKKYKLRA